MVGKNEGQAHGKKTSFKEAADNYKHNAEYFESLAAKLESSTFSNSKLTQGDYEFIVLFFRSDIAQVLKEAAKVHKNISKSMAEEAKREEDTLNCQSCGYEGKASEFEEKGCPKCGA
jgi:hypothetical protein